MWWALKMKEEVQRSLEMVVEGRTMLWMLKACGDSEKMLENDQGDVMWQ
jgi:hypothetical protein